MSDLASLQQRLQDLLEEIFEPPVEKVEDSDGYYFTYGSAGIIVTIRETEDGLPVVKVFSPILADAQKSVEMLDALNEMNSGMDFGRAYFLNGYVWAADSLVAETVDRQELEQAMSEVARWADGVDEAFAQAFGTRAAPEPPPTQAWAPQAGAVG